MKNKENKLVQAFENWWTEYASDKTEEQAVAIFIAALDTVFTNEDEIQYRALPYFTNSAKEDWFNYVNRWELLKLVTPNSTANVNAPKFSPFPLTFEIIDLVSKEVMKEKQFTVTTASEAREILDNRLGNVDKVVQAILNYVDAAIMEATKAGKNKCNITAFGFKDCNHNEINKWPKPNKLIYEILIKNGYTVSIAPRALTGNALTIEW